MSRKFVLESDCYGKGINLYKNKTIIINPEVTVLVGCNGMGKTTFIHQIRDSLKINVIPYIQYDNFHDGGKESISNASFCGDFEFISMGVQSSEGENIFLNIVNLLQNLGNLLILEYLKKKIRFQKKTKTKKPSVKDGFY